MQSQMSRRTALPSVTPMVPIGGWLNTTVGMFA